VSAMSVHSSVEEHGSGDCHHCLDGTLNDAILMVSANISKLSNLSESFKVSPLLLGCECASVVTKIFLYDDSMVLIVLLGYLLCLDGRRSLMCNLRSLRLQSIAASHILCRKYS
jgi:hypothetical protein